MRIASFNINGIKARMPRLLEWLEETKPDVACLQEIKTQDEGFPPKSLKKSAMVQSGMVRKALTALPS